MNKKVSFYTLGCRLNQAETAILQHSFAREGYDVVDYRQPADIVVVNTCTVTANSDADTRKIVNKINRVNGDVQIALVGCQAQVQKEKLLSLPNVRWVIGNGEKMNAANHLHNAGVDEPRVIAPVISRESFTIPVAGIDPKHTRANLKIQDGCDFFCSFCEIPYARGRARSRRFEDIFIEARELVKAGHRELVLTGINVGTYRYEAKNLVDVIAGLENIRGLKRIRISSIEPTTIAKAVLSGMVQKGKLCRYLHIPLQSGSDDILQKMNRNYSVAKFLEFLRQAHNQVENICLGTDVIVGFPGETDEHFQQTEDLLRELPFAYFHVFSYSDRHRALSRKLAVKVARPVIERRSRRLRELSVRKRRTYFENLIGLTETVLFEQKKKGYWTGLTDTYVRVKVKYNGDLQNRILPVQLQAVDGQTMTGKLV
ncbi:MAG TPA: tRNA (N(6)-L-threonylcarbamoyladenosine(37)-C(2))-methylthiotransferase MtaB [Bacteroidetes bacterium]|nr:tRNA (N(6)-L-threonylcarbamoyladenosine(37)-C(2))-methylthiotransferase MtaB [Bacteroidota bacterium]